MRRTSYALQDREYPLQMTYTGSWLQERGRIPFSHMQVYRDAHSPFPCYSPRLLAVGSPCPLSPKLRLSQWSWKNNVEEFYNRLFKDSGLFVPYSELRGARDDVRERVNIASPETNIVINHVLQELLVEAVDWSSLPMRPVQTVPLSIPSSLVFSDNFLGSDEERILLRQFRNSLDYSLDCLQGRLLRFEWNSLSPEDLLAHPGTLDRLREMTLNLQKGAVGLILLERFACIGTELKLLLELKCAAMVPKPWNGYEGREIFHQVMRALISPLLILTCHNSVQSYDPYLWLRDVLIMKRIRANAKNDALERMEHALWRFFFSLTELDYFLTDKGTEDVLRLFSPVMNEWRALKPTMLPCPEEALAPDPGEEVPQERAWPYSPRGA